MSDDMIPAGLRGEQLVERKWSGYAEHTWESHDRAVLNASSVSPGACRICGVHVLDHATPTKDELGRALGASEIRQYESHDEAVRAELHRRATKDELGRP